uniref:Uncharacterized protein n=1 Tax=Avena sativa TaxID=4498 RepID=A0ACD5ZTP7_AVESA
MEPVLTCEEKRWAASLLRAHGAAPVDLRTYLRDSSLAAAKISLDSPPPTPRPSCTPTSAGSKSMDPSVYGMMKNIRAEKAEATQASANKVRREPGSDTTAKSSPLCGKKRRLDEADGKEGEGPPPFPLDCLFPAAEEPSDVATPSFAGILKATHKTISALEELLEQANGELAVVKAELAASKRAAVEREKANVDLAAAKRRAEAELKKVKAELAAVQAGGKCAAGER